MTCLVYAEPEYPGVAAQRRRVLAGIGADDALAHALADWGPG